jgi:hypothetical protein
MLFYFDEAGDFALPRDDTHKVAVCVGFVLPEGSREHLNTLYQSWAQTLRPEECDRGEPKGARLRDPSRKRFFDSLDTVPDILVGSVFMDLGLQQTFGGADLIRSTREEGLRRAPEFEDGAVRDLVTQLARRFGNLSEPQVLRLFTLASCLELTLRHALLFRAGGHLASCGERIELLIDRTTTRRNSREELILRDGLPAFLANRSEREPFMTIEGVVGPDHPIERLYSSDVGFDGQRVLNALSFVDSRTEAGLQVADILANSLLLALNDLNNVRGQLKWYRRVMGHSIQGPGSPHIGPIVLGRGHGPGVPVSKYEILPRILESRR